MEQHKTRAVYKEIYAARLMKLGYKAIEILPNPRYPQNLMWIFEVNDTFDEDFEKIRGGK